MEMKQTPHWKKIYKKMTIKQMRPRNPYFLRDAAIHHKMAVFRRRGASRSFPHFFHFFVPGKQANPL